MRDTSALAKLGASRLVLWTMAAMLGATLVVKPQLSVAAGAALLLVLATLRSPASVGIGLLAWGVVKQSILPVLGSMSSAVVYAEVAAVVLLLMITLARLIGGGARPVPLEWGLVALFAAAVLVSWGLNDGTLEQLVAGLRGMLLLPVTALSVYVFADAADRRVLMRAGMALSVLQIPVVLYQYFLLGGSSSDVDVVVGTLGPGGSNLLGIWMLGAALVCLVRFMRGLGVGNAIAAGLCVIAQVATSSRLSLWLLPIGLVWVVATQWRRSSGSPHVARSAMAAVLVAAVFGGSLVFAYSRYAELGMRDANASIDTDIGRLIEQQSAIGQYSVPRLSYIVYGIGFVRRSSAFWPLGTGPATAGSGAAALVYGRGVDSSAFGIGLRLLTNGLSSSPNPRTPPTRTPQAISSAVEYGPLGFGLFFAFILISGIRCLRTLRLRPELAAQGIDSRTFMPWFLVATAGTLYSVTWEGLNIISLGFWWFFLLAMRPNEDERVGL